MNRDDLADFLRRSRERLRPEEVGLAAGPRRRTPGLRREEVAGLAGMSPDYYMRLEQARSPQPSTQMLAALARALRLTEDERDHLYLLSGHRPPAGRQSGHHVRPGLLYLLDRLEDTPAQVLSDIGDLLVQNSLAQALFGAVCSVHEECCNIIWRWFMEPIVRQAYPPDEQEERGRTLVADLRATVAKRGGDAVCMDLVNRLLAASPEFAALWERHEVAVWRKVRMRVLHPTIGPIDLNCETLLTPAEDQTLLIFTPPPGSPSVDYLKLLRVVGNEQFSAAE